jgi:adenine-specific DNA methylase
MTTPAEDKEMAAFVAWAVKKYGQHAYRHTSATSGEWAAWQAATALERERCAALCGTTRFTGNTFPVHQMEQLRMDIAAAILARPKGPNVRGEAGPTAEEKDQ